MLLHEYDVEPQSEKKIYLHRSDAGKKILDRIPATVFLTKRVEKKKDNRIKEVWEHVRTCTRMHYMIEVDRLTAINRNKRIDDFGILTKIKSKVKVIGTTSFDVCA